jgi:hypothetical protein
VTEKKDRKAGKASSLPKPWKEHSLDQRNKEEPLFIKLFRKMVFTNVFFDFFPRDTNRKSLPICGGISKIFDLKIKYVPRFKHL